MKDCIAELHRNPTAAEIVAVLRAYALLIERHIDSYGYDVTMAVILQEHPELEHFSSELMKVLDFRKEKPEQKEAI